MDKGLGRPGATRAELGPARPWSMMVSCVGLCLLAQCVAERAWEGQDGLSAPSGAGVGWPALVLVLLIPRIRPRLFIRIHLNGRTHLTQLGPLIQLFGCVRCIVFPHPVPATNVFELCVCVYKYVFVYTQAMDT